MARPAKWLAARHVETVLAVQQVRALLNMYRLDPVRAAGALDEAAAILDAVSAPVREPRNPRGLGRSATAEQRREHRLERRSAAASD